MDGNVIGINTAIISPSGGSIGIGFAIPAKTAIRVIAQLREFGETRRGWLGVRIQEVTDEIAESLGMDDAIGALVAGVTEDGPAAKAQDRAGRRHREVRRQEVEAMRELPRMVAETAIGKEVDVVVLRKGEEVTISVTLERLEENEVEEASAETAASRRIKPAEKSEVLGMTSPCWTTPCASSSPSRKTSPASSCDRSQGRFFRGRKAGDGGRRHQGSRPGACRDAGRRRGPDQEAEG
jgi:serine protease Do